MKNKIIILISGLALLAFSSCKKDDPIIIPDFKATPYNIVIPKGFPTNLNIPADNPMTVEGIKLGRYLFYDGRLSGRNHPDSLMTCGTCHLQENSFEIGQNHPKYTSGFPYGLTGIVTPHTMLPMINLVFNNEGYLWNGAVYKTNTTLGSAAYGIPALPQYHRKNIESLVWMGIAAPHEMYGHPDKTTAMIASIPGYKPLFKAAFGTEEVTYDRIAKAIAQFVRTLISSNSKAHKVFRFEDNFTSAEQQGFIVFSTEEGGDCFHCHGGQGSPLFTTNLFYNNAKDTVFTDTRDRYAVTKDINDKGSYKATTLINIEKTGPYMRDGSFKTLDEVINFYSSGLKWSPYASSLMHKLNPPYGKGAELSVIQKANLKAFLLTLTDQTFLTNPSFSEPTNLP